MNMCPHARPIKKVYRNQRERKKKDIMQNRMDMVLHLILFLSGFVTFFQKKYGIQFSIVSYKNTAQIFEKEYFPLDIVCTYEKIQTKFKYATKGRCLFERSILTKSLVNMNSFYTNFTKTHFQKVPIPHLTRTMKQKFLY